VLEANRIDLYVHYDQPLSEDELSQFKTLIKRRTDGEPVAYILGTKEFWSLEFRVTSDVLIPRPETECMVAEVLSLLPEKKGTSSKHILELGTGSGAVILSVASERPDHVYFATDRSVKAITVAMQNAKRHELGKTVHFFSAQWFEPLKENNQLFDMILSNPPYVPAGSIPELQPEIYKYEPVLALDGGKNGLDAIKHIVEVGYRYLRSGGNIILEIGADQKEPVYRMIKQCGQYDEITFTKDYSGHDRVVRMKKK
jgi:release factor glutamine methyltransferase